MAIIAEDQVEESRPLERNINSTNDVDPLSININETLFPITDKMRQRIKLMKSRMLLKTKQLKQRRPKVPEASLASKYIHMYVYVHICLQKPKNSKIVSNGKRRLQYAK